MVKSRIGKHWRFREELHDCLYWDHFQNDGSASPYTIIVQERDYHNYDVLLVHTSSGSTVVKKNIDSKKEAINKAEEWMSKHQQPKQLSKPLSKN